MSTSKLTADDLAAILANHAKWLRREAGGERANLIGSNLSFSNLHGSNLSFSNLIGSNISFSNLSGADLHGSNLSFSNLIGSNISFSNLSGADLHGSNLSGADLHGSNLSGSNLSFSNLSFSDLSGADFSGADLCGADLRGSNLSGSNLSDAKNADLVRARTEILPREGEVIGWKKCRDNVLVKLRVPPDARRSNATGRKCRAERVEVLEIVSTSGEARTTAVSLYSASVVYRLGETLNADGWTADRFVECGHGIHFYLTREEAAVHV